MKLHDLKLFAFFFAYPKFWGKKILSFCACRRFAPEVLGDHPKLQPHLHRYGDWTWHGHARFPWHTATVDATRRDGKGETITTCFLGGFVWWNFLWRLWLNCWWFCCSFSNLFRSKSATIVRIGFCWQLVWNWIPWCLCSRMVFVKSIFPYFQMRNLWPGEKDLSRSTSSDHPVIEWYVVIPI